MRKFPLAILAILSLAAATAACAPAKPLPEMLPYVELDATYGGAPVPDGTTVAAYCFWGGERLYLNASTNFTCAAGVCRNTEWGRDPCESGRSAAVFIFSGPSFGEIPTGRLPIEAGRTTHYDVTLFSNKTSESVGEAQWSADLRYYAELYWRPVAAAALVLAALGFVLVEYALPKLRRKEGRRAPEQNQEL